MDAAITFNYTTVLDVIFCALFLALMVIFFRTGGSEMMRIMEVREHENGFHEHHGSHKHAHHQHHGHSE
ncbi:hypothetical protein [Paraburkholderia sediminicola]|uniref:hypothetical protein n=1 Tax=Paraburkholderia sediminicola TaxID=458836 RepID=UPI0038B743A0